MNYAIVDIETTGTYAGENSITEIAIIIHNGKHTLEKYQWLVKPRFPIPYHIQVLTGIDNDMVSTAPTFKQIAQQVHEILANKIFVAHNVNFDYSFLVKELQLAGYKWAAPNKLCTVRLARKIIPNLASYSLGKLCQNLQIINNARHRAMGDAEATATLFEYLVAEDNESLIESTLKKSKENKLPDYINKNNFAELPHTPGIYSFKNNIGEIIYIGHSLDIKKRVLSHFTGNSTSKQNQAFRKEIKHISFEESATELMALLMECQSIKKYSPKYNKALKRFEPKFSLIQYKDQNGYIRLLVTPFDKHANAIQFFEKATEANQQLINIIEAFNLNPKLCFFHTERERNKIDFSKLPSADNHNTQVQKAIDYIKSTGQTFTIIDQGRTLDEKSYIHFKDGKLYAFGFIDIIHQFTNIEDLIPSYEKCISNYYMTSLVLQYAERFPTKVIKYTGS